MATIYVRNRDIIALDKAQSLLEEARALEEKRNQLKDLRLKATGSMSGMPRGGKARALDEIIAEIDELDEKYRQKLRLYLREQKRVDTIMESIESVTMRAFVRLMYVEKQSKTSIKNELKMQEWDYRQARKTIENARDMAHVPWRESYATADFAGDPQDSQG